MCSDKFSLRHALAYRPMQASWKKNAVARLWVRKHRLLSQMFIFSIPVTHRCVLLVFYEGRIILAEHCKSRRRYWWRDLCFLSRRPLGVLHKQLSHCTVGTTDVYVGYTCKNISDTPKLGVNVLITDECMRVSQILGAVPKSTPMVCLDR